MTRDGLNTLKELERKVDKLREEVGNMKTRIYDFYTLEEDVMDLDVYERLSDVCEVMGVAELNMMFVVRTLQQAHKAEKALMDTYDGLLNKDYEEHF